PAALIFFFFFQAEDGIRDRNVTGVQTCALPIWAAVGADRRVEPVPAPRSVARSAVPAAVDHLRAGTGRPGGGTADADRRDRRPGPAGSGHGPGPAPEGRWLGPGPDHGDRT